jgi:hypothetical protein
MKAQTNTSIFSNNLVRFAAGTVAFLLIPFVGGWPWELGDYVIMGSLIFGTGLLYELITKTIGKKHRMLVGVLLLGLLALVWAELAVGIFGTPFAGS